MVSKVIASVNLQWNEFGYISHSMQFNVSANDYQKSDGELLSVVLLTGNQLGILPPRYGLHVCDRIICFLDNQALNPEPIQYPLSKARIDLIVKKKTILCTFDPTFISRGTMEPEKAVSHLLGNLPPYLAGRLNLARKLDVELDRFFRVGLLIVINYYLTEAFPKGISRGLFSRKGFNQVKVQFDMLAFVGDIYPHWSGGLNISERVFGEILEETRSQYKIMLGKL